MEIIYLLTEKQICRNQHGILKKIPQNKKQKIKKLYNKGLDEPENSCKRTFCFNSHNNRLTNKTMVLLKF